MTTAAARSLFSQLVDYAGLFPPAALPLEQAAAEYARARRSPDAWLLGRFVVPASSLDDLGRWLPATGGEEPWRLAVLLGKDTRAEAGHALAFAAAHVDHAVLDALELKAGTPAQADAALDALPPRAPACYVELPTGDEHDLLSPMLALLRRRGARAKVRTGGVVPAAIPGTAEVARFIAACARAGVPFKATAGLHHPLRRERPLTYAGDAPRAVMHGFLNVFAAAALAWSAAVVDLEQVLREEDAGAFRLDDEGLAWRQHGVSTTQLAGCRESFAVSFGSCSFSEPVAGLQKLGLLA